MGVVYKLKPEIISYIIETKKKDPGVSCRGLVSLIQDTFQVPVSKSSVNSVFKFAGLSSPVGRRRKPRRGVVAGKGFGCLLLKACDSVMGGSSLLVEAAKSSLPVPAAAAKEFIDHLLFSPHFNSLLVFPRKNDSALGGGAVTLESFSGVSIAPQDAQRFVQQVSSEALYGKVTLPHGKEVFFDPQFHTIWSSSHIPSAFSLPLHKAGLDITGNFFTKNPFNFLMVPGYEAPTREFFEFVSFFGSETEKNAQVSFGLKNGEELKHNNYDLKGKINYIFGLWPWQFGQNCNIKMSNQFNLYYFEPLKQDFYISEATIELFQPQLNSKVELRGCALKNSLSDQVRVYILTNLTPSECSLDEVAGQYLRRWFSLESAFRDFSKKMELFAAGNNNGPASEEAFDWQLSGLATLKDVASRYALFLQWYLLNRVLPSGGQGVSWPEMEEFCLSLEGTVKRRSRDLNVHFSPSSQYAFRDQLAMACLRLNQQEVSFDGEKRVWFYP